MSKSRIPGCEQCRWYEDGLCPWGRDTDHGDARVDTCDDYRAYPRLKKCDKCGEQKEVTRKPKSKINLCRECLVGPDLTGQQDPIYRQQSTIAAFENLADPGRWE